MSCFAWREHSRKIFRNEVLNATKVISFVEKKNESTKILLTGSILSI